MEVILYTGPGCPFCIMVKKYLENNKIDFKTIDISKDKEAEKEMVRKSGQPNIPVVDAGGHIIIGYDIRKLKEALGI